MSGEPVGDRGVDARGFGDPTGCIHVGVRGPLYTASDLTQDAALGFKILHARDMEDLGTRGTWDAIAARIADRPVYVSVDIDVLDPAFAPGTGTPESGGLLSRELLALLRHFANANLIGADVVEVAPAYDHAQITGIAASHALYELISAMAVQPAPPAIAAQDRSQAVGTDNARR